jgi:hypothetical protein
MEKGLHLLGALDFPATLEAGRPLLLLLLQLLLLLLLLLLLVPVGEITPRWWWWRDRWWWWWWQRWARWWWWRQDRRTDVPLRAIGLGAGLLGPTSSPLTLLGGPKQANCQCDACGVASLPLTPPPPPVPPGAEALLVAPLPLSKGLGATAGALGAAPEGWGPPATAPRIWILRRGSRPLGVKTGRDYPAGTGYGYLKYQVFRVPDTGNFIYGSDTDTTRICISRIRVGYRMTTTR